MKIIELSIRRRVTISMVTLAIVIFGFVAFDRLEVTLLPDLTYPTLTVRTEYPGAAPIEVENLVTKPVEEALGVRCHVPGSCPRARLAQKPTTRAL
ncbi:efflux RND transporter permease subunit, partial [candidate division KSB1 bacterium]|nr:efflux RND transporter permease subunit [candidate division KSB1 bacterium]